MNSFLDRIRDEHFPDGFPQIVLSSDIPFEIADRKAAEELLLNKKALEKVPGVNDLDAELLAGFRTTIFGAVILLNPCQEWIESAWKDGRVRPEAFIERLAIREFWLDYTELLRISPAAIDYMLADHFFAGTHFHDIFAKAQHLARVVVADQAARSAIADIEAELGL